MTYRELTMIDVREVLRRWAAGQGDRQIGRETGIDRKTVARYREIAEELKLPRDRALVDDEIHEVAQRVQARPLRDRSAEWAEIAEHKDRIAEWLGRQRPLRLRKIHLLLKRDCGLEASYDTLRRFAIEELGWRKKAATVRLEDPPAGQVAQIDFGRLGQLFDEVAQRARVLWALIVTLSFSRYQFVWPTFSQTTEAICEGLDRAWWFFDAMVRGLLPDNMSCIVKDADRLSATLVPSFLDYAQARGIFVDPARIRSPRDKARVENQVPYVRESWFDGETFRSLDEARRSAEYWCHDIAGARVHGTTRQVPRELFETVEKPAMLPPPGALYDVPVWIDDAKVHPDHHIQALQALYSVPHPYLRKHVRVRADKQLVKIYYGTELIKVHPRKPRGGRSTDPADYPSEKAIYALRDVDALGAKAREQGEHVGQYADRLLGGPLPWTRMRQVYALLRLCDKYGAGRVEAICQSALAFDVVDVTRVTRMVKTAAKPSTISSESRSSKVLPLPIPTPRFARPDEQFATKLRSKDKEGC
jgi:transposase